MTKPLARTATRTATATPLTVRTEIRRQWARRRTRMTLGFLAALPVILVLAFRFGAEDDGGTSFLDRAVFGAANFTVFTLVVSGTFLLVVVAALFFGDAVASEASWGSLRYLLAVPISRARLLAVKLAVSALWTAVALLSVSGSALAVGTLAFGWNPLRTPFGDDIPPGEAVWRIGGMVGYVAITLLVVAALGFLLSVRTDAPLAAVGGAVLLFVVSRILDQVEALGELRNLLPTHFAEAWQGWFADPVQLEAMAKGAISAFAYASVFLCLAWWWFQRKDILS